MGAAWKGTYRAERNVKRPILAVSGLPWLLRRALSRRWQCTHTGPFGLAIVQTANGLSEPEVKTGARTSVGPNSIRLDFREPHLTLPQFGGPPNWRTANVQMRVEYFCNLGSSTTVGRGSDVSKNRRRLARKSSRSCSIGDQRPLSHQQGDASCPAWRGAACVATDNRRARSR